MFILINIVYTYIDIYKLINFYLPIAKAKIKAIIKPRITAHNTSS